MFSTGEDALPNGLDVTFEVTELKRLTGSYNTMVGNNEGSMVSSFNMFLLEIAVLSMFFSSNKTHLRALYKKLQSTDY